MKASILVRLLQELINEDGDLDCMIFCDSPLAEVVRNVDLSMSGEVFTIYS